MEVVVVEDDFDPFRHPEDASQPSDWTNPDKRYENNEEDDLSSIQLLWPILRNILMIIIDVVL